MRSFRVARVHGIDIKLHPTFALVLLWLVFDWQRTGADLGSFLFGLMFVVFVFGAVLLHEFGHAFMALHFGIPVQDITLSVVGGVARVGQMPLLPRIELLVAVSGPLVNLILVMLLLPWLFFVGVASGLSEFNDYVHTLLEPSLPGFLVATILANVFLFLFNLIPAFPMDGGRILRAILGAGLGRTFATRIAVRVGQGFAVAMVVVSIVWIHSITLPLIAVFIAIAAQSEDRAVRIETAIRRMRVGQVAVWDMGGVTPDQPLSFALRGGLRDVVVTEKGQIVGMLWRNRLLHEISVGVNGKLVADLMDSGPIVTADIHESVFDVQQRMNQIGRPAIPVVEDGKYRGIFTLDRLSHLYRQVSPPLPFSDDLIHAGSVLKGLFRSTAR